MIKRSSQGCLVSFLGSLLIRLTACRYVPTNETYLFQVVGPLGTRFTLQCTTQAEQWLTRETRAVALNTEDAIRWNGAPQEYRLSGREIRCSAQNFHPMVRLCLRYEQTTSWSIQRRSTNQLVM